MLHRFHPFVWDPIKIFLPITFTSFAAHLSSKNWRLLLNFSFFNSLRALSALTHFSKRDNDNFRLLDSWSIEGHFLAINALIGRKRVLRLTSLRVIPFLTAATLTLSTQYCYQLLFCILNIVNQLSSFIISLSVCRFRFIFLACKANFFVKKFLPFNV